MDNSEICDSVPSQKENNKINVQGYLMGRATTTYYNRFHYLKKFVEHSHSPQPSNAEVAKTIKQKAPYHDFDLSGFSICWDFEPVGILDLWDFVLQDFVSYPYIQ
ncbi:19439_t:CDS:2 [Funneliformis geosporum]|nr:19439_t:CDS:2 [Funneliformis geosporum]